MKTHHAAQDQIKSSRHVVTGVKTVHILPSQTVKWLAVFSSGAIYTGRDMPHFNSRFSQRGAN